MHEKEDLYWGTGGTDDRVAEAVRQAVKASQQLFRPILKHS